MGSGSWLWRRNARMHNVQGLDTDIALPCQVGHAQMLSMALGEQEGAGLDM